MIEHTHKWDIAGCFVSYMLAERPMTVDTTWASLDFDNQYPTSGYQGTLSI